VQDFDGDLAAQVGVLGALNFAHAAQTELFLDAVMAECLPDHSDPQKLSIIQMLL
jgi:hypothetical protein